MAQTTATGLQRWLFLFESEVNEKKVEHFYAAQTCSEIACLPYLVWGKEPPKELRDLKNFMIVLGDPEEIERKAEEAAEQRQKQDAELSRSIWLSHFDIEIGKDGKAIPRKEATGKPTPVKSHLPPHILAKTLATQRSAGTAPTGETPPESTPEPQPQKGQRFKPPKVQPPKKPRGMMVL